MDDLISRAAACECIGKMIHEYREKGEDDLANGMILARRYGIKRLPAVDAAPVVRCKDCMYFRPWRHDRGDDSRCEFWNAEIGAEDYCSQAIYLNNKMDSERRDSDA